MFCLHFVIFSAFVVNVAAHLRVESATTSLSQERETPLLPQGANTSVNTTILDSNQSISSIHVSKQEPSGQNSRNIDSSTSGTIDQKRRYLEASARFPPGADTFALLDGDLLGLDNRSADYSADTETARFLVMKYKGLNHLKTLQKLSSPRYYLVWFYGLQLDHCLLEKPPAVKRSSKQLRNDTSMRHESSSSQGIVRNGIEMRHKNNNSSWKDNSVEGSLGYLDTLHYPTLEFPEASDEILEFTKSPENFPSFGAPA